MECGPDDVSPTVGEDALAMDWRQNTNPTEPKIHSAFCQVCFYVDIAHSLVELEFASPSGRQQSVSTHVFAPTRIVCKFLCFSLISLCLAV